MAPIAEPVPPKKRGSSTGLNPIPAMIERCEGWFQVCTDLDAYFARVQKRYETTAESERILSTSVSTADDISSTFAGPGCNGIRDVFSTLRQTHASFADSSTAAAEALKTNIRPKVTRLISDLERSLGDFKSWTSAFRDPQHPTSNITSIDPSLRERIELYENAIAACSGKKTPTIDPYVIKLSLDRKIRHVVHKMNKQADSFAYAQDAAKNIDAAVSDRLQGILAEYGEIEGKLCQSSAQRVSAIVSGFVTQPKLFEYHHWLESQLAPHAFTNDASDHYVRKRSGEEFSYPDEYSVFAMPVKTGSLERRTRVLHSYNGGDYVLTMQSLIELAREKPIWSVDLQSAELVEGHKANTKGQFVLRARQHGSHTGKVHTFVFKSEDAEDWKRCLQEVLSGQIPKSVQAYQQKVADAEKRYLQEKETARVSHAKRDAELATSAAVVETAAAATAVTAGASAALSDIAASTSSVDAVHAVKSITYKESPTAQYSASAAAALSDSQHFAQYFATKHESLVSNKAASPLNATGDDLSSVSSIVSDVSDVEKMDSDSSDGSDSDDEADAKNKIKLTVEPPASNEPPVSKPAAPVEPVVFSTSAFVQANNANRRNDMVEEEARNAKSAGTDNASESTTDVDSVHEPPQKDSLLYKSERDLAIFRH